MAITKEKTQLIVTTNPGLEDIVIAEFERRFAAHKLAPANYQPKPVDVMGRVLVETPEPLEAAWAIAQKMRSIHHVHRPVAYFRLTDAEPLAFIRNSLADLDIPEMETAKRFRVTTKRSGTHGFTSIDVASAAGAGLVDRYGCTVDLTGFDTNVRVDVDDDLCSVMVQLTREPLDYRYDYAYRPRVALKSNVAFALLVLAGVKPDGVPVPPAMLESALFESALFESALFESALFESALFESALLESALFESALPDMDSATNAPLYLLDPFCGSGTILMEAGTCLPHATLFGGDWFEGPVTGTRDNLAAAALGDRVAIAQGDARDIHKQYPAESMDVIVTNPPFGAQLAQDTNLHSLYRNFLEAAVDVIKPNGRIVMLVWKRPLFNKVVQRLGLQICHARVIDLGGLFPGVFILKKQ